jgi:hypothetical protein
MQLLAVRTTDPVTAGHPHVSVLNDFVDGMLSVPLLTDVAAHVESCWVCGKVVADLRELIAVARAEGQELVRAPAALFPLVSAVTIGQQLVLRYILKRNRLKLMVGAFGSMAAAAVVGVWLVLGCRADTIGRQPRACEGAWHQVVRRGAQQRVKELRDYAKRNVSAERKQIQHSLSP